MSMQQHNLHTSAIPTMNVISMEMVKSEGFDDRTDNAHVNGFYLNYRSTLDLVICESCAVMLFTD